MVELCFGSWLRKERLSLSWWERHDLKWIGAVAGLTEGQNAAQQQREAMPSEVHLQHPTLPARPQPPKHPTSWEPSAQTHEPMGDSLH